MDEEYKKYYKQTIDLLKCDITMLNKFYLDTCISHAFNTDTIISQFCLVMCNTGIAIRATGSYNLGSINITQICDEKVSLRVRMVDNPKMFDTLYINVFVLNREVTEIYGKWYPYIINTFMPKFHQSIINVGKWIEETEFNYKTEKNREDKEFINKCDILFGGNRSGM